MENINNSLNLKSEISTERYLSRQDNARIVAHALSAGFSEEEAAEIGEAFGIASEDERIIILDVLVATDISHIGEDEKDDNYAKKGKAVNRASRGTLLKLVREIIKG